MDFSTTLKRFGVEQLIRYLHKDPEKNMLRLMDWADKFAKGEFVSQRKPTLHTLTIHLSVVCLPTWMRVSCRPWQPISSSMPP